MTFRSLPAILFIKVCYCFFICSSTFLNLRTPRMEFIVSTVNMLSYVLFGRPLMLAFRHNKSASPLSVPRLCSTSKTNRLASLMFLLFGKTSFYFSCCFSFNKKGAFSIFYAKNYTQHKFKKSAPISLLLSPNGFCFSTYYFLGRSSKRDVNDIGRQPSDPMCSNTAQIHYTL